MKTGNKFSQFKLPGLVGHQQVTASIPFAMTTVFKKMFYPDKNYFLVGFVESSASREFRTNTSMVTTMTRQLFLSLAAAAAAIHIDLPAVFNPFKYENRFEKLGTLGSWSGSNTGQLFQCLNNDFCPKHKKRR